MDSAALPLLTCHGTLERRSWFGLYVSLEVSTSRFLRHRISRNRVERRSNVNFASFRALLLFVLAETRGLSPTRDLLISYPALEADEAQLALVKVSVARIESGS